MRANDLKKGAMVLISSGVKAELMDNKKGNVRDVKVFGLYTETGTVYSHDIIAYEVHQNNADVWNTDIEYSRSQLDCKKLNDALFA